MSEDKIRRQFMLHELTYLDAVDALVALGVPTEDAEERVEEWEGERGQ